MEPIWATITCEVCDVTYSDEWPALPQNPADLKAWVARRGCPVCGAADASVEEAYISDASRDD
jgi:hypothetical protein